VGGVGTGILTDGGGRKRGFGARGNLARMSNFNEEGGEAYTKYGQSTEQEWSVREPGVARHLQYQANTENLSVARERKGVEPDGGAGLSGEVQIPS